jgi:hypothetical protein
MIRKRIGGKRVAGVAGAAAIVAAAVAACGTSAPAVVHAPPPKPTVTKTVTATRTATAKPAAASPRPTVTPTTAPTPTPAASTPPASTPPSSTPAPATSSAAAGTDYLGDVFGGGTGNPCNFATGYQAGVCNPTGETEQQYIEDPGGPAPGTSTNAQGCYYVRMGEGYCPSTGKTVPMQDPNG